MPDNKLWLARDMGGSGLYTLWINNEPEINSDGYYKYSAVADSASLLLVTIHPSKFPWNDLVLDKGDCIVLELHRLECACNTVSNITGQSTDIPLVCVSQVHYPPARIETAPGVYSWTCKECGEITTYTVDNNSNAHIQKES